MSSADIKIVSVVGTPQMLTGERRRGGSRKRRQEGGDNAGAMMQVAANHVPPSQSGQVIAIKGVEMPAAPGLQGAPLQTAWGSIKGGANGSVAYVAPATPIPVNIKEVHVAAPQNTNEKNITVELKKNKTMKKVMLNPKKQNGSQQQLAQATSGGKNMTRKNRKITLGMASLHKRVTRAKKIREKVKEMPIGELRGELVKRGLVRQNSKAPESVLRQIAADAQIVGGKGL